VNGLSNTLRAGFRAAIPLMLGYLAIGIPCGILEAQIGYAPWMAFFVSATFYSGAGQFMTANMWLAGQPVAAIAASVSFVNTRQVLYSAAFAPYAKKASKRLALLFSAFVTDESFGVNLDRFSADPDWNLAKATAVNIFSMLAWSGANFAGAVLGEALPIPVAIASFAMTAIFVCLLATQKATPTNLVVGACAMAGVVAAKFLGLDTAAILIGAVFGVACGVAFEAVSGRAEKDGAPGAGKGEPA
jgi:4-azaleucine resistance transporter AzlC